MTATETELLRALRALTMAADAMLACSDGSEREYLREETGRARQLCLKIERRA